MILVMAAVIGLIWYAWTHRNGALARSIGSAGVRYNELYGQGSPPKTPWPTSQSPIELDEQTGDDVNRNVGQSG